MACNHMKWRQRSGYICDYSGDWVEGDWYEESTCRDISTGAFKCTSCGYVGYYTGRWKESYEYSTASQ